MKVCSDEEVLFNGTFISLAPGEVTHFKAGPLR